MSMNLTLYSSKDKYAERFPLWQTPTEVTFDILGQKDPYQAYLRWLRTSTYWNWNNPAHVEEYKQLKRDLLQFLRDHPKHEWGFI